MARRVQDVRAMLTLKTHRARLSTTLLAGVMALGGCAADVDENLDPAASLGSDEWADQGPEPAEQLGSSDEEFAELSSAVEAVTGTPRFELPFGCGQVWAGQTRTNHSPTNAVDFNRANDIGDAVLAAAAGTVSRVANTGSTSYGRWVEIDHGAGYRTRYAHLNSQSVRVGQRVSGGQLIGTVGSTGGSSGPHLHYELIRNGVTIRPVFHGVTAYFWGTRNYTSFNNCAGGGSNSNTGGGNTASGAVARVNTRGPSLTVRSGPGVQYAAVGSVPDGATVRITCQTRGSNVSGVYGTSTLWDRIATGGYIADAYVYTGSDGQVAPNCR